LFIKGYSVVAFFIENFMGRDHTRFRRPACISKFFLQQATSLLVNHIFLMPVPHIANMLA
jgi:hypothetical protein